MGCICNATLDTVDYHSFAFERFSTKSRMLDCFCGLSHKSARISDTFVTAEDGDGQNTDPQSMDSPNGLPLKWTTPKNNILNEYYLKL